MMDMNLIGEFLAEPKSLEELKIPQSIPIDIILRTLYSEGNVDMRRLSQVTRIPTVLEDLMDWLRREQLHMDFDEVTFNHLLEKWYRQSDRLFQAVHPRDLLKIVQALCEYEGISPQMRPDLIDEACVSYFVMG